jgi:tetratricopeptide (TPR) repeat protein
MGMGTASQTGSRKPRTSSAVGAPTSGGSRFLSWPAGLLFALVVAVYLPVLQAGFIWDDDSYVVANRALRSGAGLWRIWTDVNATPQYYPLVHTMFWIERHLWGLHPAGFHLVNVILHGLAAVLLWQVLARLRVPGAWLASALFALHPVTVESVAWITERKNVLSAVFYFASALAYLRFVELADSGPVRKRRWFYAGALALFVAALLSKTVTCSLPAALLLVLWWKRGRLDKRDILALAPFFAVGVALGLTTAWLEKHHVGAEGVAWSLSFSQRCLIAGRALWFYAEKIVWPARLTFIYPRWDVQSGVWWQWLFPITAVGLIAALWLARRRIGRGPIVAVLFFAGTLAPALGFVNVYPMRYSFVADHFQYLAAVGLFALIGAGMKRLPPGVAAGVLTVLAALSWHQERIYQNVETLWSDTLAKNPGCWMAHNNLGMALAGQRRFDAAIDEYRQSVEINPQNAEGWCNWGAILSFSGQWDEAMKLYRKALAANPNYSLAHYNLGVALAEHEQWDEAIEEYHQALRNSGDNATPYYRLAVALSVKRRTDEAIQADRKAVELEPEYADALNHLGFLLMLKGQMDEAIVVLRKAVRLLPDLAIAHRNLGNALCTQKRFDEAVPEFAEALRIEPGNAEAHLKLAKALTETGRSQEAISELKEALRLKPDLTPASQLLDELSNPPPPR